MENNNIESVEIELPEEVMRHVHLAAKEVLRAELAFVRIVYGDSYDDDDDDLIQDLENILIPKMMGEMIPAFEEICEEEGVF